MPPESFTRRQMLGYLGLGSAALAAGLNVPASAIAPPAWRAESRRSGRFDDGNDGIPSGRKGRPNRVIVIGAGFAGLAAANALRNAGVETIVLEGRARNGGRAHTVQVGGSKVDLGASWIHEPVNNTMSRFASQAGVDLLPASPESDAATILLFDELIGRVDSDLKFAAYLNALQFDGRQADLARRLGPRASVRDGAQKFLDELAITGDERRLTSFFIQLYAELEGAKNWAAQPLALRTSTLPAFPPNHPPYEGLGLGDFPVGGYARLVAALARNTRVRHGHQVVEVKHDRKGVAVTARFRKAGKLREVTFKGSHALVTVPLGVLKARTIRFDPPLPRRKTDAIKRIGVGNLEKVALTFPRSFWQEDGATHLLHVDKRQSGDFPMFIDLQRLQGQPSLVALNAGSAARSLTASGPARTGRRAMEVLRRVYGDQIPEPRAVRVTAWQNDPYSRGSYSAVVLKTRPEDRNLLAAPLNGRILFAGEATNTYGRASTTDGAFSTGIREAKRLLHQPSVALTS